MTTWMNLPQARRPSLPTGGPPVEGLRVLVAHNLYRSAHPSGENLVVTDEIDALRAAGVSVRSILTSSDAIADMAPLGKALTALGPVYHPQGVRMVREAVRRRQVDVVHLHNVYPLLSPWAVRAAKAAGVPVVQTVHNFRHDCVSGTYFRDGAPCTQCASTRLALPAIHHACYRGSRPQTLAMAMGRVLHADTWRSVDRFLVLTDFHAEYLQRRLGIPPERIVIRPTTAGDPGSVTPPGRDVLFLGRWTAEKGLRLLLEGWHTAGPLGRRLLIAGAGPDADLVHRAAAQDASVVVLGRRTPAEAAADLDAAGALVVPSQCYEGFPRAVAEAMAHGRAVLASRIGGLSRIIDESVGALFDPHAGSLAAVLTGLDDNHLRRWGAAARTRFERELEPRHSVNTLLAVYRELIGEGPRT